MSGLESALLPGLTVFNGVTGYMDRQKSLELRAQAQADRQAAAAERTAERAAEAQRKQAEAAQKRAESLNLLTQSQQQETDQLRQSLADNQAADQRDAAQKLAEITQSASETERKRQLSLRTLLGTAAATAGAHTIDPNEGSALAARRGKIANSEADKAAATTQDRFRIDSLNAQLQDRYQRNLLQQSQLADKQRLQYLSQYYG